MVTTPIAPAASTTTEKAEADPIAGIAGAMLDGWHLTSLDAPTVAVVWSWAFADAAHTRVPVLSTAMLAVATWLLYVADRLLDAMQPSHAGALQQRHCFHLRHAKYFLAAALPAMALLTWFVAARMDPAPRREDFVLGACALLYLLCVHLPLPESGRGLLRLPKELAVGVIFAAACVIPSWSRMPALRGLLLLPAVFFGLLCWINCSAIEYWEARAGLGDERVPWLGGHLKRACVLLCGASVFGAAVFLREPGCGVLLFSVAMSALLVLWLDRNRQRMTPLRLRAAVDAVLLTPVLLVAGLRLLHRL